jgi:putative hydrolase of HD superfamily
MKSIYRQTILADKTREETDAEHSWHFALMAMVLFEYCGIEGVDIDRVIRMALVHDLIEIYAGDTFAYDVIGNKDKAERETAAADKLFSLLPDHQSIEYRALWEEFERMDTPDAIYASAVDRLQPFLNNYLTDGHTWVKHNVTVSQVYKRMAPIKDALPALWEFIERVIHDNAANGNIKADIGL